MPSSDQAATTDTTTDELLSDHVAAAIEPAQQQLLQQLTHRFSYQASLWGQHDRTQFQRQLIALVVDYVGYLPALLRDFKQACCQQGWQRVADETDAILLLLFSQDAVHKQSHGIMGLLDKIYFAHRLIEELHDHLLCCGLASLPGWNMTSANLLIHQLLGEEYSARLDQSAMELAEKIFQNSPKPELSGLQTQQSQHDGWPCFCARYGLSLNLTG